MTRNVAVDVRIWRNQHVVSDRDPTDDGAAGANPDAIPQGRTALPPASVLLPDSHSFVEIAITSNHRPRIDRDPVGMAEIQPSPDSCRMGYLKPVPTRHPPQQKSGEEPTPLRFPQKPKVPQRMASEETEQREAAETPHITSKKRSAFVHLHLSIQSTSNQTNATPQLFKLQKPETHPPTKNRVALNRRRVTVIASETASETVKQVRASASGGTEGTLSSDMTTWTTCWWNR